MTIEREEMIALRPRLRAFARGLTGCNASFADDLVQDTILNALESQDQFTPGTNLKAWLFTILRNRFYSVIGRKHVSSEVPMEDGMENRMWIPPDQESALEMAALRRAFNYLSPHHREVILLAIVHGLSYERIAEICNCEIGTIKSRMSRARVILKRMVLDGEMPREELPARPAQRVPAPSPQLRAGARRQVAGHMSASSATQPSNG